MPTSGDINGIAMADIADINGIDMPSGGGASEPSSGILTLGGSTSSNPVTRAVDFDQFKSIQFHSSVSTALSVSDVSEIKGGRYMVGILDTSGNLWMASGANSTTGGTGSYGGYVRQFAIELTSVAEFSCGDDHALAIKTDGTLWGIGRNGDGPLGRGNTSSQYNTFDQIGTDTNWSKVSCGEDYSLAIKTTGALYSAGKNQDGRTGQGTTSGDTTSWTQIGTDTDWTQISTGQRTSAAIKGGTLVTWGDDTSNCLGLSSSGDQTSPDTANSDTDWQSVWVGADFIKAIKTTDGHHYHCGSGGSFGGGTRGDGSTSATSTFTRIGSDTGWSEFVELKTSSFIYLAAGKKGSSWYICGRYNGVPYIKTGGTATTSSTTTFVQLADPAPSKFSIIVSDGSKPEAIYVV